MFVCPIFYSVGMVPAKVNWLVNINPLSTQFELFRYAFLGRGTFNGLQIIYGVIFMVTLLFAGVFVFNKWSDKLIDVA
jgi:lipopolysaccharide transport system permease protein